jgi:hypothetical protein
MGVDPYCYGICVGICTGRVHRERPGVRFPSDLLQPLHFMHARNFSQPSHNLFKMFKV